MRGWGQSRRVKHFIAGVLSHGKRGQSGTVVDRVMNRQERRSKEGKSCNKNEWEKKDLGRGKGVGQQMPLSSWDETFTYQSQAISAQLEFRGQSSGGEVKKRCGETAIGDNTVNHRQHIKVKGEKK